VTQNGPSPRAIVKIVLTIAATVAGLYFLYLVRSVLVLLFISVFLAVAMGPGVDRFQRLGLPRGPSILAVFVGLFLAIVGVGMLVVPPVVTQVEGLSANIPNYITDLRKNDQVRKYDDKYHISAKLNDQAKTLPSKLGSAAGALRDITVGVFSTLVQLVTVLTMTFFLLLDGGRIAGFLLGMRGPEKEAQYRKIAGDIYRSTSGYVAGNLVISVIAGLVAYVSMLALGIPFAVPLAVLMAFLDLIPLVGATIGGVIIGLVAAFHDFPTAVIIWAVVFIVYQQVENNVIQPLVYRKTVDVSPLLVITAILIGSSLLGVLGALVAIPVAAAVQTIVKDFWRVEHENPSTPVIIAGTPPGGSDAPPPALIQP
jgi:predicted PurR-regulated permease PerM